MIGILPPRSSEPWGWGLTNLSWWCTKVSSPSALGAAETRTENKRTAAAGKTDATLIRRVIKTALLFRSSCIFFCWMDDDGGGCGGGGGDAMNNGWRRYSKMQCSDLEGSDYWVGVQHVG